MNEALLMQGFSVLHSAETQLALTVHETPEDVLDEVAASSVLEGGDLV